MQTKSDKQRLQAWVPAELKAEVDALLQDEAMTLTELVTQLLRERVQAHHTRRKEHYIININKEDTLTLLDTLNNPPAPAPALQQLAADYQTWAQQNFRIENDTLKYDFRHLRNTRQKEA